MEENIRLLSNRFVAERVPGVDRLSEVQIETLVSVLAAKRDTLLILPTGSGKSLPFQIMPVVAKGLRESGGNFPEDPIVIVVCPLVSLMKVHVREMANIGVKAAILGEDCDEDAILNGRYSVVMGSPESWLMSRKWRDMLLSKPYQQRLIAVVADEVHCIPKWGMVEKAKKERVFRECFGRLGELRSFVPANTPMLCLTATATKTTVTKVKKNLTLIDVNIIQKLPDRTNVLLNVHKVSTVVADTFHNLVDKLAEGGVECERVLVYCTSTVECGTLFKYFKEVLGTKGLVAPDEPDISTNRTYAMYHRSTPDHIKETILSSLLEERGTIRVVFATNALGMGVNIKAVRHVINYGFPKDVEAYIQESGRAGRDGKPANAYLLYHSYHLVKADIKIKEYAKTEGQCRRDCLMSNFQGQTAGTITKHLCCDNCEEACDCGECAVVERNKLNFTPPPLATVQRLTRNVSDEDISVLREVLNELNDNLTMGIPNAFYGAKYLCGLSASTINRIVEHAPYIFGAEYVAEHIPVQSIHIANDIVCAVSETFEDFDFITVDLSIFSLDCEDIDFSCSDMPFEPDYESDED